MRREKREREERPRRRVGFKTILHFIEIVVIAAAVVFVANRFAPKNETQITSSFISDKLEMVSERRRSDHGKPYARYRMSWSR